MNKTIKIENFIERVNNLDFKTGTKIKFQDKIYLYDYPNLTGIYEIGKPTKKEYSLFAQLDITNLHCEITIIEEQDEIDIQPLNAYKLIEVPYMKECLDKNDYTKFCELLKQSELELVENIEKLAQAIKQLDKNIKEK